MTTTYITAVNTLLKELNEVELNSTNFSSAVGIHAFAKDIINRAYFDIVNAEDEWPFLIEGVPEEPFRGSLYLSTVAGQRWYLIKSGSADVRSDFKSIDWDNIYLTDYGVAGATAPYENRKLPYITTESWIRFFQVQENSSVTDGESIFSTPRRSIVSADSRFIGMSPIPDKEYRVYFNAWIIPIKLSLSTDELVIPDRWMNVLYARARYYMWQFKESPQQAVFALTEYKEGLFLMRRNLIEATPDYITDDRARFI
jgi:hypothetical protein